MPTPKILAVLVVKDEVDVVERTIVDAARWAAHVLVLDNGSSDGTAAVLERIAEERPEVAFLGVDDRPFTDGLRAVAGDRGRHLARPGDWWCRLDADESIIGDPWEVLRQVHPPYDAVEGSMFKYYLTREDVEAHDRDPAAWLGQPLEERLRWYRNDWAELRFLRHRRGLRWVDTPWPEGTPRVSPLRVSFRHYQYRTPAQVERRLTVRADVAAFAHEHRFRTDWSSSLLESVPAGGPRWHERLARAEELDRDDGGPPRSRPDLLPPTPSLPGPFARVADRLLSATPARRAVTRLLRRGHPFVIDRRV
ncbi:MAG: glycosyl transferase [Frankiales bacterium]|nr:glycosyl transferase [Frankiales bacterium]